MTDLAQQVKRYIDHSDCQIAPPESGAALLRDLWADHQRLTAEIEATWKGIERGFAIEPRALIEQESKTNGFKYGLAQAIHTIWKREPKVEAAEARVTRLEEALRGLVEAHHGYHVGLGPCVCPAHEAGRAALAPTEPRG